MLGNKKVYIRLFSSIFKVCLSAPWGVLNSAGTSRSPWPPLSTATPSGSSKRYRHATVSIQQAPKSPRASQSSWNMPPRASGWPATMWSTLMTLECNSRCSEKVYYQQIKPRTYLPRNRAIEIYKILWGRKEFKISGASSEADPWSCIPHHHTHIYQTN